MRERLRPSWPSAASDEPADILRNLRLEWARRVSEISAAEAWGAGAAALVVARTFATGEHRVDMDLARRAPQLGHRAIAASNLRDFIGALPEEARWVFDGLDRAEMVAEQLWMAESSWWLRLDRDGDRLLHGVQPRVDIVIGAVARRMADAWRAAAALDLVSRGTSGEELVDVIA